MNEMSEAVVGVLGLTGLLLGIGAISTAFVAVRLERVEPSVRESTGWVPERDRVSTVRGAMRLFAAVWSSGIRSAGDAALARAVIVLRCVHVLYFGLFFALLAFFLFGAVRA